jgi:hypothetical protein
MTPMEAVRLGKMERGGEHGQIRWGVDIASIEEAERQDSISAGGNRLWSERPTIW